ncbi:hypothetical protein I5907_19465 [Panacibacter sp. DH6]|uniref:Helix-turn-helix domain-containing protein n=1 Tax=Panacibacter microcysteis TaxID=2793269 RepID=A0A931MD45_9BACT|nr:hypothetical protein [Panacibacter microcysteis]MBG9378425.1 hypothetical protein [Panacibacter microcysteis]
MDVGNMIRDFMELIQEDPRIRPSHISLFLALVNYIKCQQGNMPVVIFKREIIKQAKVSAATFHRCINELNKYGYIKYLPSCNAVAGNLVSIPRLSE